MKDRADIVLYKEGYVESIRLAQSYIMQGLVFTDERKILKAGEAIDYNSTIRIKGKKHPFVSRGGLKLNKAVEDFGLDLKDKTAIDIGASTGGFTDCMLQKGAGKVFAIDVGYGQLDWKLQQDSRVVVMDRTNIRDVALEDIGGQVDFISADVSFISLKIILPIINELLREDGASIILIKPQFEARKEDVGQGGVIRDSRVHQDVLERMFLEIGENKLGPVDLTFSPITGAQGNIEFLALLRKNQENNQALDIASIVDQAHENFSQ